MIVARRSGSAYLPLHGGRVPAWLGQRMTRLGRWITETICLHYGRDELIRRLSHPFWFQSFGAVMGMDWHSSGITTSVLGALKRGLGPVQDELGIYVCGGRGRHSRKTPGELMAMGERTGADGNALAQTSRLVAKVDSAAVQDGFEIYLHSFITTADGKWVVVQQGMNGERKQARRYHWLSDEVRDFCSEPHTAIDGPEQGAIVNLVDRRAESARQASVQMVCRDPDGVVREVAKLEGRESPPAAQLVLPTLHLPDHHDVQAGDVVMRRLRGALVAAAERGPEDFPELLLTPGVGARTVAALALVADVVHGAPSRFSDPARYSAAHGGKDGHPFPVPLAVYDQTIATLKGAVQSAKLGQGDKLAALERLDREAKRIEAWAQGPSWDELVADERRRSHRYGGMTVDGPATPPASEPVQAQGSLFTARGGAEEMPAVQRRGGARELA